MTRPVAIVLAVFEPDPSALVTQVRSIAAQKDVQPLVLVVVADRSSGPLISEIMRQHSLVFELLVPETETNSYDSFGHGLAASLKAFPEAEFVAFADQDDVWAKDKLDRSIRQLTSKGASLAHTDARVVDADGLVVAKSLHRLERRLTPRGLRDLLAENSVTGMTAVMTREAAEATLPFPRQAALFFHHDLWVALVAWALGGIVFVPDSLVDYRQHSRNVVGAVKSKRATPRVLSQAWRRHWGGTYFVATYLAKSLYLRMEELDAIGCESMNRSVLAGLGPYLSERGLGFLFLLDSLSLLLRGRFDLARRSFIFAAIRVARVFFGLRRALDQSFLPALADIDRRGFAAAPGIQPSKAKSGADQGATSRFVSSHEASSYQDFRTSPRFTTEIDPSRSAGVTVFLPSLNPSEIFAGIATAIDFGLGLQYRGHNVRFVATDLPIANEVATRDFLQSRSPSVPGPASNGKLEVFCGQSCNRLMVSRRETLVATAWWTTHLASKINQKLGMADQRLFYLIQDFEPGFYPWGDEFAGALESYKLGAEPIINSTPLAKYLLDQGLLAVFDPQLVFHPAIDIGRYARLERPTRTQTRIAVYGRPEVPRNLFATAVQALELFLGSANIPQDDLELISVGMPHPDIKFASGHKLRSLGKIPWAEYPNFLANIDIGLSLMLSPHPSHPPLEMAAAGARVITNTFGTKCLSDLTPAINSVAPEASAISDALALAWRAGPLPSSARTFDLAPLGRSPEAVLDELSDRLFVEGPSFRKIA